MSKNNAATKIKCGLIMPISGFDNYSEAHWAEVKDIIEEALPLDKYEISMVSDADESGVIHKRIVNNVYYSDIVICDVSGKNANVMFELGMRLAFDKPTVIIKDNKTSYSFDTSLIEHIPYPEDLHYQSIGKFKTSLKLKVDATLKVSKGADYTSFLGHFGDIKISGLQEKEVTSQEFMMTKLQEISDKVSSMDKKINKSERNEFLLRSQYLRNKISHEMEPSNQEINISSINTMDDKIPF